VEHTAPGPARGQEPPRPWGVRPRSPITRSVACPIWDAASAACTTPSRRAPGTTRPAASRTASATSRWASSAPKSSRAWSPREGLPGGVRRAL